MRVVTEIPIVSAWVINPQFDEVIVVVVKRGLLGVGIVSPVHYVVVVAYRFELPNSFARLLDMTQAQEMPEFVGNSDGNRRGEIQGRERLVPVPFVFVPPVCGSTAVR